MRNIWKKSFHWAVVNEAVGTARVECPRARARGGNYTSRKELPSYLCLVSCSRPSGRPTMKPYSPITLLIDEFNKNKSIPICYALFASVATFRNRDRSLIPKKIANRWQWNSRERQKKKRRDQVSHVIIALLFDNYTRQTVQPSPQYIYSADQNLMSHHHHHEIINLIFLLKVFHQMFTNAADTCGDLTHLLLLAPVCYTPNPTKNAPVNNTTPSKDYIISAVAVPTSNNNIMYI